jgi:hypothetical protein
MFILHPTVFNMSMTVLVGTSFQPPQVWQVRKVRKVRKARSALKANPDRLGSTT